MKNFSKTGFNGDFLSCDWGTSSLRLRFVSDHQVVREQRSDRGARSIFQEASGLDHSNGRLRAEIFSRTLRALLENWSDLSSRGSLPLMISGMASSSIGWMELPYAPLPLKADASSLHAGELEWAKPGWVGRTWLVSGVASATEMMRGEETEAVGLLSSLELSGRSILILPGTHSKHLLIENGVVTDFWTFMTGELFDVLCHHSVLRATVAPDAVARAEAEDWPAFEEGVRQARERGLGRSLFQARTRSVLGQKSVRENAWFLSGLLIGSELVELFRLESNAPVKIAGGGQIRPHYTRAASVLAAGERWSEAPAEVIETAVPRAHAILLNQLQKEGSRV